MIRHQKRGGYSFLIRPILIVMDISVLIGLAYFFIPYLITVPFLGFLILSWLVSSYITGFYKVYRFTSILKIISLVLQQGVLFLILMYAYFGLFRIVNISFQTNSQFVLSVLVSVGLLKITTYYSLKRYRSYLGGNNRHIIIIGNNKSARQLESFFNKRKDLGYFVDKIFASNLSDSIKDSFAYIENNRVDEIYCAVDEVSDANMNYYVKYANKTGCVLKFIPNTQKFFPKQLKTDYYEYLPILSIPDLALNRYTNRILKRIFDILFSAFVSICILSWLIPVLYIFIKLESPGPLFYKHKRNGINYKEFTCYKFRSMRHESHKSLDQVKKEDSRVTNVGRFIRRTSIDELPQFINVFLGDMSVVGPRPHMLSYTESYAKKINKYNFVYRHSVKPGVTGLAQVKGFRGEIEQDEDLVNRIKYDIYYIENWSLLLDLKIILNTTLNILKGDEKAY